MLAGYLVSLSGGRMGRGVRFSAQLGQRLARGPSAQGAQKVHSKEQMRAAGDSGGRSVSQRSQLGRSSNMVSA